MNIKLLVLSIFAVVMLVGISFATAVNPSTTTNNKKKESPLFKIRTRHALGEKLREILKNVIIKFLDKRIFWIPLGEKFQHGYLVGSIFTDEIASCCPASRSICWGKCVTHNLPCK